MYYGLMEVDAMLVGVNFNLFGRVSSKVFKFICMESFIFKNNYYIKYFFFLLIIKEWNLSFEDIVILLSFDLWIKKCIICMIFCLILFIWEEEDIVWRVNVKNGFKMYLYL